MKKLNKILKIAGFSTTIFMVSCATQFDSSIGTSQQQPQVVEVNGNRIAPMKLAKEIAYLQSPIVPAPEIEIREKYQKLEPNKVTLVTDKPVSTFSIDVDTGSYSNMRRMINQGNLPRTDAIRLEEMVNYFDYQYLLPNDSLPFKTNASLIPTPWNSQTHLLSVAIKGAQQEMPKSVAKNLVFLVDVSGSMREPQKLPLVKKSLLMLSKHLTSQDRIAIVVYAAGAGVVLPSTPGDQRAKILQALTNLKAGGSTNGAAGIHLAYQIAKDNYIANGINRVLLATDGDFNVGVSEHQQLVEIVEEKRKQGIFLNTLGFGSGNYNDYLMEQIADKGNGIYAYIDSIFEAKKVLVDEIAASLVTIAKDVKIQLEFNPAVVHEYRLLGYENRMLAEEDFSNDKVDAGEIGAGHTVTALYEISLKNSDYKRLPERRYSNTNSQSNTAANNKHIGELAWLKLRYKKVESQQSELMTEVLKVEELLQSGTEDNDIQFAAAVAAFAQRLKNDQYLEGFGYPDIVKLAEANRVFDPYGRKAEFVQLVNMAQELSK